MACKYPLNRPIKNSQSDRLTTTNLSIGCILFHFSSSFLFFLFAFVFLYFVISPELFHSFLIHLCIYGNETWLFSGFRSIIHYPYSLNKSRNNFGNKAECRKEENKKFVHALEFLVATRLYRFDVSGNVKNQFFMNSVFVWKCVYM